MCIQSLKMVSGLHRSKRYTKHLFSSTTMTLNIGEMPIKSNYEVKVIINRLDLLDEKPFFVFHNSVQVQSQKRLFFFFCNFFLFHEKLQFCYLLKKIFWGWENETRKSFAAVKIRRKILKSPVDDTAPVRRKK